MKVLKHGTLAPKMADRLIPPSRNAARGTLVSPSFERQGQGAVIGVRPLLAMAQRSSVSAVPHVARGRLSATRLSLASGGAGYHMEAWIVLIWPPFVKLDAMRMSPTSCSP